MRLGSTVVGRMQLDTAPVIEIPAPLSPSPTQPAVWVVDPKDLTVSLRNVEVARNDPATVAISEGLDTGEIVVTAGRRRCIPARRPACWIPRGDAIQSLRMGARPSFLHRVLHARADHRGRDVLLPPRPQRGSGIHLQDDGRAGGLAGATLQETLDQVTERIERTLKETPSLDFLRSYTSAGRPPSS
jgi:hypothetical protein